MELTGGCLCGVLRFRVTAVPFYARYCHCSMCQKLTGGPFQAGATVPIEAFAFTKGTAKTYESSPGYVRLFCGDCGSPLGFQAKENPKLAYFTLGCLDDPNTVVPQFHMYTSTQINWCDIGQDLPRHAGVAPESARLWAEWEGGGPSD